MVNISIYLLYNNDSKYFWGDVSIHEKTIRKAATSRFRAHL